MNRQTGALSNPSALQPVLATWTDTQCLDCLRGMTQTVDGLGFCENPSQDIQVCMSITKDFSSKIIVKRRYQITNYSSTESLWIQER